MLVRWPECCGEPMRLEIKPISLECGDCGDKTHHPGAMNDMGDFADVVLAAALAILDDPERIDPFARRDARELLRGFVDRTE